METQELRETLVRKERRVMLERLDLPGKGVPKVKPVLMVRREIRAMKVPKENKALQEKQVTRVHLETKDHLVNQVARVKQDLQEIAELQESLVNLEVEVPPDKTGEREFREKRGMSSSLT